MAHFKKNYFGSLGNQLHVTTFLVLFSVNNIPSNARKMLQTNLHVFYSSKILVHNKKCYNIVTK